MPLDKPGLEADLITFFQNLPNTEDECREEWADLVRAYTTGIVPAVPGPVQDTARNAFSLALVGFNTFNTALTRFDSAFAGYGAAIAAGQAPVGVAPPALISVTLGPVFTSNRDTGADVPTAAAAIATVIDAWFRTGTNMGAPWS